MKGASAALLCIVVLAGCGAGGDSQGAPSSTPPAPAAASSSESAEASIEEFGEEAEGKDREQLLSVFHGYLGSLAVGDEAAACAYLGEQVRASLGQFSDAKEAGCPEILEAILVPEAGAIAHGQERGRIEKVRLEGDTAFVVFHAPGARLYQMNLAKEDGKWKASLLSSSVLAPSLRH